MNVCYNPSNHLHPKKSQFSFILREHFTTEFLVSVILSRLEIISEVPSLTYRQERLYR